MQFIQCIFPVIYSSSENTRSLNLSLAQSGASHTPARPRLVNWANCSALSSLLSVSSQEQTSDDDDDDDDDDSAVSESVDVCCSGEDANRTISSFSVSKSGEKGRLDEYEFVECVKEGKLEGSGREESVKC